MIKLVIWILFDQVSNFFNIMETILDLFKLGKVPGLGFFRTFNMLLCTYF